MSKSLTENPYTRNNLRMSRQRAETGNQHPINFGFLITLDENENRAMQRNLTVTNYGLNKMETRNFQMKNR